MLSSLIIAALCLITIPSTLADTWAILVAGSNGYVNYRHQADVAHAYQVLKANGIDTGKIVTMMYDDVAHNPSNPYPGQLFNIPNGEDVYAGIHIDYSGAQVTTSTFLNVMHTLPATAEDDVFLAYFDHGGVGMLGMPTGPLLYVDDLTSAIQNLSARVNSVLFYIEACESGSMMENVSISNFYSTTAANPSEPSWATYCPSEDIVGGQEIGSCLGDLYSVSWIQNAADANNARGKVETLEDQYQVVKTEVNMSQVMQYGNLTLAQERVCTYESGQCPAAYKSQKGSNSISSLLGLSWRESHVRDNFRSLRGSVLDEGEAPTTGELARRSAVSSRDASLLSLRVRARKGDTIAAQELGAEMLLEQLHSQAFRSLAAAISHSTLEYLLQKDIRLLPQNMECYKTANAAFAQACAVEAAIPKNPSAGYTDSTLRFARVMAHVCQAADTETVVSEVRRACADAISGI